MALRLAAIRRWLLRLHCNSGCGGKLVMRSKSKHKRTRSTGLWDDTDWDVTSGIELLLLPPVALVFVLFLLLFPLLFA